MFSQISSSITAAMHRSIGRCDDYAMVAESILTPIAERIGASAAAFFQLSTSDDRPLAVERSDLQGPFAGAGERYARDLFRNDPLFSAQSATPTRLNELFSHVDSLGANGRFASYQRDLLLSNGIGDIIGIYFPLLCGTGRKMLQISFQRRAEMPDYTPADAALLAELAPTLRLVLSNLALSADAHILDAIVTSLADRLEREVRLIDERTGIGYVCGNDDREFAARTCAPGTDHLDSPDLPAHLSLWLAPTGRDAGGADITLTAREREIVAALRAGHSNASMAHALSISIRTVENHLRAIYCKASVNSRTQLIARLARH